MKHIVAVAALALVAACTTHHTESDSKSNWLRSCTTRMDCPTDASCTCGVCTKTCASDDECLGLPGQRAQCVNPTPKGLPACDSDPVSDSPICLMECTRNAECGMAQSCYHGLCISATLADAGVHPTSGTDGGVHDSLDAGGTSPNKDFDAGVRPPLISVDAGKTKPVIDPQPSDEDAGGDAGSGCGQGLIRHIDGTCIEPGVDDAHGIATLVPALAERSYVFAADLEYLYGVQYVSMYGAKLMRWPTDGGDGEALATGTVFQFFADVAMVVDASRLYFVAATDPADLSSTLWSMPKDDSAPPAAHGFVGNRLAQDQDYLYFSNDGDSRVVRAGKSTLDSTQMTEQVFVSASDAPGTIGALTVNTDSVFVKETPPHGSQDSLMYTIQRIAKASNTVTSLGTNDRFSGRVSRIVADDTYFVLGGDGTDRLSLATQEVKPLGIAADFLQIEAGTLYGAYAANTKYGNLWLVNLSTLHPQNSLTSYRLFVTSLVENSGSMFVTLSYNTTKPDVLLRITPQP
jgi:hypothetical protein